MFGEGISKAGEIIDLGAELNIIKKSGSWYSYNDTKLGQGRDAAKQCVADNPELADELSDLINSCWHWHSDVFIVPRYVRQAYSRISSTVYFASVRKRRKEAVVLLTTSR